jgi:transcriptional regulator with XRE-family HTH domain
MNFAQRLKKRRADLGLTREFVAGRSRTSPQSVWRWETGASVPDIKTLVKLADALQCSVGYLFGESTIGEEMSPRALLEAITMLREQGKLTMDEVVRAAMLPISAEQKKKR